MLKLHYAPRTRSVRVRWLLEELGIPYELVRSPFRVPAERFFAQDTPLGKFPVLIDGDVILGESGAIVEYVLERYGNGRLAPPVGSPDRAAFLQWIHFAESTAFPPIGVVVWLTLYRNDTDQLPEGLLADARDRAHSALAFVEKSLAGRDYLVGDTLTAADVMMGFTLAAASLLGLLDGRAPGLNAYLARLSARPAFQAATAD